MADNTTAAPITVRLSLPLPSLPRLGFAASLAAIYGLVADAFDTAYVAPYTSLRKQPQLVRDDELEGRDPTW